MTYADKVGSNLTHGHSNYLICMRLIQINTVCHIPDYLSVSPQIIFSRRVGMSLQVMTVRSEGVCMVDIIGLYLED